MYLNKILVLQKKALRQMNFKSNKEHAIPLFTNFNVLPLNMIYYKSVCNLMYMTSLTAIVHQQLPIILIGLEIFIPMRKTRHSASNYLYIEYSRLNKLNASFVRSGVKIWNRIYIPMYVHELGKEINKVLHKYLLTILGLADDYVDVPISN
jgi:hypothetical protein